MSTHNIIRSTLRKLKHTVIPDKHASDHHVHKHHDFERVVDLEGLAAIPVSSSSNQDNTLHITTRKTEISMADAHEQTKQNSAIVMLDVRYRHEYKNGHIKGAVNIPIDELEDTVVDLIPDKKTTIYCYSQGINRASHAVQKLRHLGYRNAYNAGSIEDWEGEME